VSCKRTRAVLERQNTRIVKERSARKEPFSDAEVRALLRKAGKVIVLKGKKATEYPASKAKAADLKGPSGNYRAPMLLKGKTLLVGFNEEALLDFI
jgi:arsenate reductase-like glutaredoxin family protein